ncbi:MULTISPECIES: nitrate regulatory protein [Alcaligenaceae]|nr:MULTISPECIES: nitrate regulatory protein [Alcaligenaceae]QIM47855.1 ANTAR domain-containing protein [Pusillimonas sp. DMV24BSW_D]
MFSEIIDPIRRTALRTEIEGLKAAIPLHDLTQALGRVTHALQRERGATQGYLNDLDDTRIALLKNAVALSDSVLPELLPPAQTVLKNPSGPSAARLFNRLADALSGLQSLQLLRQQCFARRIRADTAFEKYASIITRLLHTVYETTSLWVDPHLAAQVVALFSVMQAKEYAGQERALTMAGFTRGSFSKLHLQQITQLIHAQEACIERAKSIEKAHNGTLGESEFETSDMALLERMRRLAHTLEGQNSSGESLGEAWFQISTARIESLLNYQKSLENQLKEKAQARLAQATIALNSESLDAMPATPPLVGLYLPVAQHPQNWSTEPSTISDTNLPPELGQTLMDWAYEQQRSLRETREALAQAEIAAQEIKILERGKTRLMQWYGWTEDQAHRELRRMAMNRGRKLIEIAGVLSELTDKPAEPINDKPADSPD